jgi:Delta14-sterol reductase
MAPKRARAASVKKGAEEVAAAVEEVVAPHGFEFGGPIGTAILTLGLPPLCYLFAFVCNDVTGCPAPALLAPRQLFSPPLLSKVPYFGTESGWQHGINTLKKDVGWPGVLGLLNVEALLGTLAWYGLSLVLWALLPAHEVDGTELRSGGRLKYRLNCTPALRFRTSMLN